MSLHQPKNYNYRLIPHVEHRSLPSAVLEWMQEKKTQQGQHRFQLPNLEYLLIALGERPNPGYKLEIMRQEETEDGTIIYVKESHPQKGMVFPQIVISPYLLLEIYQPVMVEWLEQE
ncbi:PrcB C-terminal [Seinonella peptonophila]|uniref:PrcB C-terminal n=1 Tax=Seinonella peptonophila TaxID=112248 RepID=A0A1M4TP99_9BACL|nr:protease complex subunit PrcB family protein [Seinonella peptonophila]SHE46117.1 PrcB C-terminal [Seinonella peptonophila]